MGTLEHDLSAKKEPASRTDNAILHDSYNYESKAQWN